MPNKQDKYRKRTFRHDFVVELFFTGAIGGAFIFAFISGVISIALGEFISSIGVFFSVLFIGAISSLVFGLPLGVLLRFVVFLFENVNDNGKLKTVILIILWLAGVGVIADWGIDEIYDFGIAKYYLVAIAVVVYGIPALLWTFYRDPWEANWFEKKKQEYPDILDAD